MVEIEISYAMDDSCQMQLWAKGHHFWGEFVGAVYEYLKENDRTDIPHWVVAQAPLLLVYQRSVPCRDSVVGDTRFVHQSKPGRGATPVTVMNFWFPLFGTGPQHPTSAPDSSDALLEAAKAVVRRWDTPTWKDAEPTGAVINRLRAAIAAKEQS